MARNTPEGKVQYYWANSIANTAAPTVAEMTAAIQIGCEIAGFPDMLQKGNSVDTPDLCSTFIKSIPGPIKIADTEVTFYLDDAPTGNAATIKSTIVQGANGFIIRVDPVSGVTPAVNVSGTKVDINPVRIAYAGKKAPAFGAALEWAAGLSFPAPPAYGSTVS